MGKLSERLADVLRETIGALSQVEEDIIKEALARLSAYEDTGMEPCDYATMRHALEKAEQAQADLTEMICIVGGVGYNRIRELAQADKEHRLIVPPCKVGDTVFCLLEDAPAYYPDTNGWYISKETVHEITTKGLILCEIESVGSVYVEPFDQIGKTIFLTYEEAEKALRGVIE